MAEIGRRLLAAVESAFPQAAAQYRDSPLMRHRSETVSLPRRRASYQEYLEAKKQLHNSSGDAGAGGFSRFCQEVEANEKIPGRPGPYDSKLHHFVLIQNNKAVRGPISGPERTPGAGRRAPLPALGRCGFRYQSF